MKRKKSTRRYPFAWLFVLLRFGFRHPGIFLLVLAAGLGGYGYELKIARPAMLYQGEPIAQQASNPDTWFRTLRNHGFILGYSDLRGNPLWVEYALKPVADTNPSLKRPSRFSADWRSINQLDHDSYQKSGYDRGHMAPNYAMSQLFGKQAQLDSFLMTNITPQKAKLNQQLWQRLEEVEINTFAKAFGKVWVITGPIFDANVERLPSAWTVEIPDAFYKIYLTEAKPTASSVALSFIVPQTVRGNEPLSQFVATIDTIEAQTGLDFFADLDDKTETALESAMNPQAWHLSAVSNLPSRY